jgi:transcriptional regulator with XRE-family HTH domain
MTESDQAESFLNSVNTAIGARVAAIREQRNLSRPAISRAAEAAGLKLSQSHLAELETGSRRWNIDNLLTVAKVLKVELRDLLPPFEPRENPAEELRPEETALLEAIRAGEWREAARRFGELAAG